MVTVAMNGLKQVRTITIDPEVVSKDDVEFLQDLVVAAINDAHRRVDDETGEKMGALPATRRWRRRPSWVDDETGEKMGALLDSPLLPGMVQ